MNEKRGIIFTPFWTGSKAKLVCTLPMPWYVGFIIESLTDWILNPFSKAAGRIDG